MPAGWLDGDAADGRGGGCGSLRSTAPAPRACLAQHSPPSLPRPACAAVGGHWPTHQQTHSFGMILFILRRLLSVLGLAQARFLESQGNPSSRTFMLKSPLESLRLSTYPWILMNHFYRQGAGQSSCAESSFIRTATNGYERKTRSLNKRKKYCRAPRALLRGSRLKNASECKPVDLNRRGDPSPTLD